MTTRWRCYLSEGRRVKFIRIELWESQGAPHDICLLFLSTRLQ